MLAAIPSPPASWATVPLGPFVVHTSAVCALAGMAVAVLSTMRRLRTTPRASIVDIALWAIPFGLVGARVWHVLSHGAAYFAPGIDPLTAFAVQDGGVALYGSFAGGAVGALIGCHRADVRFGVLADALAPGLLAGLAIGRLGDWFGHDLFGPPTTAPWGLVIESTAPAFPPALPPGTLFEPLFLVEIGGDLLGAGIVLLIARRLLPGSGRLFVCALVWYGAGRAWLEALRLDPTEARLLGVPVDTWASILIVAAGVAVLLVRSRRSPVLAAAT